MPVATSQPCPSLLASNLASKAATFSAFASPSQPCSFNAPNALFPMPGLTCTKAGGLRHLLLTECVLYTRFVKGLHGSQLKCDGVDRLCNLGINYSQR